MGGSDLRVPWWRKHSGTALKVFLGGSLLWLLHDKGLLDLARIGHAMARHPFWIGAATLLHGALFAALGLRWRYVAMAGGVRFSVSTSQKLTFVSHFFSTCLPGNGAGDLVKGVLLSRAGIPFSEVLGTMVVDRVAGMAGLFLAWNSCMAGIAILHPQTRPLLLAVLPFSLAMAAMLLASLYATSGIGHLIESLASHIRQEGLAGRIASRAVSTLRQMTRCTAKARTVTIAVIISVCSQCLLFLVTLCAAHSLSIPLGFLEIGVVIPLASLANALPLSPGGLGVGETTASVAFAQLGQSPHSGAEVMLVVRMVLVTWAIAGGIIYAFSSIPKPTESIPS